MIFFTLHFAASFLPKARYSLPNPETCTWVSLGLVIVLLVIVLYCTSSDYLNAAQVCMQAVQAPRAAGTSQDVHLEVRAVWVKVQV